MAEKRIKQISEAVEQLEGAIDLYEKEIDQRALNFLMITKAFEVLVEESWKVFKKKVENEGLDAPSPKEAIRKAARIGLTDSPEKWIEFIDARNLSVHDYFGLSGKKFLVLIKELLRHAKADIVHI